MALLLLDFIPLTTASVVMSSLSKTIPVPTATLNAARFLVLGACVVAASLARPAAFPRLSPANWGLCALSGALLFAVTYLYVGLIRKHGLALTTAFANVAAILAGLLVGMLFFKEELTRRQLVGVAVIALGIGLVNSCKR